MSELALYNEDGLDTYKTCFMQAIFKLFPANHEVLKELMQILQRHLVMCQ